MLRSVTVITAVKEFKKRITVETMTPQYFDGFDHEEKHCAAENRQVQGLMNEGHNVTDIALRRTVTAKPYGVRKAKKG